MFSFFHNLPGKTGDRVTIRGSGFSTAPSDITVSLDGTPCAIDSSSVDTIECTVGAHSAGTYGVVVYVEDKGLSADNAEFEYELTVSSVSPSEGDCILTITP